MFAYLYAVTYKGRLTVGVPLSASHPKMASAASVAAFPGRILREFKGLGWCLSWRRGLPCVCVGGGGCDDIWRISCVCWLFGLNISKTSVASIQRVFH